jgi:hypothetical protein
MYIAKVVLWIGIVLMPIGFGSVTMRLSILMPIQARIRVLPQFLHMLENQENLLDFYSQRCRSTLCCLSSQRHRWHAFQYFGQYPGIVNCLV